MPPCLFQQFEPVTLAQWLDRLHASHPGTLLFALLPEAEATRVGELQALCAARSIPLLGAVFPALIDGAAFRSNGVALLPLPEATDHFLVGDLAGDPVAAARDIANALAADSADGNGAKDLFLVFDSMQPNTSSLLTYLFSELGRRFRYSGVCAGSETFQPIACLFDNQRSLGHGALGIVLPPTRKICVEHAYPVAKSLMRATSTQGNRIDRIDGKPAMAVYQQVIADDYGIALTHDNFYDYAVHYPFGLVGSLEILVRIPVAFNEDGSIFCVGEVPPDSMLRLLRAPALESSACIGRLIAELGTNANPLLTFYCAGRRMHFGPGASEELAELQRSAGTALQLGALSLGEIATDNDLGIPEFHNAALVCLR
ncbi:FIST signal transduction protein [Azonexus caeni]|jgi:hypothetical protein|uniref:FIST signal transduction protein n=1 Tax=Azonexus caeni TaxID=266126 RepID=UPI003A86B555